MSRALEKSRSAQKNNEANDAPNVNQDVTMAAIYRLYSS